MTILPFVVFGYSLLWLLLSEAIDIQRFKEYSSLSQEKPSLATKYSLIFHKKKHVQLNI